MARKERYIVGLDVGTSTVIAVVGELVGDDGVNVVGLGVAESRGIKRGVVVNLDAAVEAIKKAGSLDQDKLIAAMAGLQHGTPFGNITYRTLDHQSTMGAYVGRTTVRNGRGTMRDFRYADGAQFQPSDAEVAAMRPKD